MAQAVFEKEDGLDEPSGDYVAMVPYWDKVDAILGGVKTMRDAKKYLPKFPHESRNDYQFRQANAKLTNVFHDIVANLAAKPFSDEAGVADDASDRIKELSEDIDGQGNHIHVFAANMFLSGIAYAIDYVLVDYTSDVAENATIADEKRVGARPYWVHIPAMSLKAAYTARINGKEEFVHVRIQENSIEREGYTEKKIECVRVLERELVVSADGKEEEWAPATWAVYELEEDDHGKEVWNLKDDGAFSIGVIPLVPFLTGRRKGSSWQVEPPMQDCADLQIELYQQESGLKYAKEQTAFPMLAGNGVAPPLDKDDQPLPVRVGPKSVLYAPPNDEGNHGEWKFIEPSAESLKFLAADVKETISQLRELGRQPLSHESGNLTVITARQQASKVNSAIGAWVLNLKDAVENALRYTAMWLKEENAEPKFNISMDFDVGLNDEKGPETLLKMRATGDLSQETLWREMRRRSILSPEFDAKGEEEELLNEIPGEPNEADGDDVDDVLTAA